MTDAPLAVPPVVGKGPITLLWRRTALERVPESYFIERILLGGLQRPIRVLAVDRIADAPFLNDVIVASLTTEFAPYLSDARRRGMRRLVLLHLGDELGANDRTFYDHADLVLRNYWFDHIVDNAKVHWVPNGYAIGVGPAGSRIPASLRSIPGFYAGALGQRALSAERHAMRRAVDEGGLPFQLHWTATLRDRLGAAAYAAKLGDARFALVPGGNSPETIRLYDALEMGAIPVMLNGPFVTATSALGALGMPPILLLNDWSELPIAYAAVVAGDVDATQARIRIWWEAFRLHQRSRVAALIQTALAG